MEMRTEIKKTDEKVEDVATLHDMRQGGPLLGSVVGLEVAVYQVIFPGFDERIVVA
jgi:hypothetical protein